MIRNYKELASTQLRKKALDILIAGLESVLPHNILPKNVQFSGDVLTVCKDRFTVLGNLYIIGGGKSSGAMAAELERIIPLNKITAGLINTPFNVKTKKIRVNKAAHPVPDQNGLVGVKQMIDITRNLQKGDIVICLISGGGSALLPYPAEGISLEDKQKMTELLITSGVETYEMQYIRKHISKIKGGQLAKLLQPAKVISLIISDVVNKKDVTAAGPTEPDESTFEMAYRVLEKYNLLEKTPKSIINHLKKGIKGEIDETPKKNDALFKNIHNYIITNNKIALNAMKAKAEELGFKADVLKKPVIGEARYAAKKMGYYFKCKYSQEKAYAVIYGSENTVKVKGNGKGGRNQEYAASLIKELKDLKDCVAISAGSDGVDFIKSVGGAIVDDNTYQESKSMNLNIRSFLDNNNTYELHKKLGTLLRMDATGTNVGDLNIYMQEK